MFLRSMDLVTQILDLTIEHDLRTLKNLAYNSVDLKQSRKLN